MLKNSDIGIAGINAYGSKLNHEILFKEFDDIDIYILINNDDICFIYKNDMIPKDEKISIIKYYSHIHADFYNIEYATNLYKQVMLILRN
jgi:hypothetical protein